MNSVQFNQLLSGIPKTYEVKRYRSVDNQTFRADISKLANPRVRCRVMFCRSIIRIDHQLVLSMHRILNFCTVRLCPISANTEPGHIAGWIHEKYERLAGSEQELINSGVAEVVTSGIKIK